MVSSSQESWKTLSMCPLKYVANPTNSNPSTLIYQLIKLFLVILNSTFSFSSKNFVSKIHSWYKVLKQITSALFPSFSILSWVYLRLYLIRFIFGTQLVMLLKFVISWLEIQPSAIGNAHLQHQAMTRTPDSLHWIVL